MVLPKPTSNPNQPIWQLRGLVSISVALQNQFKCDSSHYVVFTDVAKYLDWIKSVQQGWKLVYVLKGHSLIIYVRMLLIIFVFASFPSYVPKFIFQVEFDINGLFGM